MCGVAGFVDFKCGSGSNILSNMVSTLNHRGPDDEGTYLDEVDQYQLGLGHKRLSILDLSPLGHQPMKYENLVIVYNGEVYNFKEIRQELESLGYDFQSQSDTEVILKSYHCWGDEMVLKLNGMFAIIMFDKDKQELTLFRDRAGVKPLYWFFKDGLFLFGSELKSLCTHPRFERKLNFKALSLFLQFGYVPQPLSIYQNTHKLFSGHFLKLDLSTATIREEKYWEVFSAYVSEKSTKKESEILEDLDTLISSACNYRMVSDVPVGVFLSGGYDSSLVTAMVQKESSQKIKTFTIGFEEEKFNEAIYAKQVADHLGTDHHEYLCSQQEALNLIQELPDIWDEPFADSSGIPTYLVSKLARNQVVVSLSADGGDELFGGYEKYQSAAKYLNWFQKYPIRSLVDQVMEPLRDQVAARVLSESKLYVYDNFLKTKDSKDSISNLEAYQKFFFDNEIKKLSSHLEPSSLFSGDIQQLNAIENPLDQMMAYDYATYQTDDILTKVDRATMAHSLEGREPLLDYRLIDYVGKIPTQLKLKGGVKKYLLKEIAHRYLPKSIMERPKMGFSVPLVTWLKNDLKYLIDDFLNEAYIKDQGVFHWEQISKMVKLFEKRGDINYANRIWNLLVFQIWYQKWMKS
ncbi:asparagine synthase (glutamine-hydrolyzing) [Algoriphagus antarcticus]|uniref:asparagine synthase (glutamine-hydrolyzing) n=1 Tax=Algoriphagus antarcticus TaxID=238540 RepID=A0A3E0DZH7_9BACT|nr:asparagine synthase (glutamine-hydrolyzing) [Algoriphagus antarcticus]REG91487.1 asparagine synthase (glutamine-hydrolysing) [Algoriphagus antarcticus]